jgi:hypothetical protein
MITWQYSLCFSFFSILDVDDADDEHWARSSGNFDSLISYRAFISWALFRSDFPSQPDISLVFVSCLLAAVSYTTAQHFEIPRTLMWD